MNYRLAEERDIDAICALITSAIAEMERNNIYQWDNIYPAKEDFLNDIIKKTLYVGTIDDDIAVVYAINKDADEQYANGTWAYPTAITVSFTDYVLTQSSRTGEWLEKL